MAVGYKLFNHLAVILFQDSIDIVNKLLNIVLFSSHILAAHCGTIKSEFGANCADMFPLI